MDKIRITVALHNAQAAEKIKYALQRSGYLVGEICTSSGEAIRRIRMGATDILLINQEMPDMTGLEVATIVGDENLCSVILLFRSIKGPYARTSSRITISRFSRNRSTSALF
jgi:Response regulator receiver domain.